MTQKDWKKLQDLEKSTISYVAYNAAKELASPGQLVLREKMTRDPKIQGIISELMDWPGPVLNSHKSASQFFHKFSFLGDIGLRLGDPSMDALVNKVIQWRNDMGIPLLRTMISQAYGGTGKELKGWAICDAPTTLWALHKVGYHDPQMDSAVEILSESQTEAGWGCRVSPELGTWRGPGKKSDPCPYGTLLMVKVLAAWGGQWSELAVQGALCLLDIWERSRDWHPYIFYTGTDFRKLKLPFIWWDILHVTDVLSQVGAIHQDPRFLNMLKVINEKETEGGFTPESVYLPWKDWDFGQKKVPSPWMEFCVLRIRNRIRPGADGG